jgi:hypothetical protein
MDFLRCKPKQRKEQATVPHNGTCALPEAGHDRADEFDPRDVPGLRRCPRAGARHLSPAFRLNSQLAESNGYIDANRHPLMAIIQAAIE